MASVTNNALNREIGELKTQVTEQARQLGLVNAKLDTLVDAIAMSKGSLRTLMVVGSAVATIAAGLSSLLTWFIRTHTT